LVVADDPRTDAASATHPQYRLQAAVREHCGLKSFKRLVSPPLETGPMDQKVFRQRSSRFWTDESGATAIEYGLIVAVLGLVVLAALTGVSHAVWNTMTNVATSLHG
jgi:pilus assembly protein Flp/PilA